MRRGFKTTRRAVIIADMSQRSGIAGDGFVRTDRMINDGVAFAGSNVVTLFPTFLWVHELMPADFEEINGDIRRKLDELMKSAPPPAPNTTFQTASDLHLSREFRRLNAFIKFATEKTLDFLNYEQLPFEITGCWANIGTPGAVHNEHSHPNNFLSGVYYVHAPDGANTISFRDPRMQAHTITGRERSPTMKTASTVTIDIKAGRMVLFPAWLLHRVERNKSDENRISVSFNIMFTSYSSVVSKTKWMPRTAS